MDRWIRGVYPAATRVYEVEAHVDRRARFYTMFIIPPSAFYFPTCRIWFSPASVHNPHELSTGLSTATCLVWGRGGGKGRQRRPGREVMHLVHNRCITPFGPRPTLRPGHAATERSDRTPVTECASSLPLRRITRRGAHRGVPGNTSLPNRIPYVTLRGPDAATAEPSSCPPIGPTAAAV